MAFKDGHNKVDGRKKGTPNRLTKKIRALLKGILYEEIENIPKYLESLEPKERLDTNAKLLNYEVPKIKPIDSSFGEPVDWDPFGIW